MQSVSTPRRKPMALVLCLAALAAGPARAADVKLACIGNSITAEFGYPDSLRKLLGPGYVVENDGVSSTTVIRRGSYPYFTKGKLAQVFAFKPDWITIKLGTNDSRPNFWGPYSGEFKRDYLALLDTLGTLSSKPKIWVVIPTPCWRTEADRPNDANLEAMVPILRQIASERGLPIIDARTPLLRFQAYFQPDGIHPNAAGSDTIAHVLYRGLMASTTGVAIGSRDQGSGTGNLIHSRNLIYFQVGGPAGLPALRTIPPDPGRIFDVKGARHRPSGMAVLAPLVPVPAPAPGRVGLSAVCAK